MDIQIGKQYVNKTWRFLAPCLRGHGTTFVNKFNSLYKLAVGIHDTFLDGSSISNGRNIYVLIDKGYKPREYEKFLDYIRYQDYFKGEYCAEPDLIPARKYMVVLEVPKIFYNAYDKFLQGKYSEMYTTDELNILFSSVLKKRNLSPSEKIKRRDYGILTKTLEESFEYYIKVLNKEFNTTVKATDIVASEVEWELPLKKQEEIFNYPNGQGVFFNEELDKVWQ